MVDFNNPETIATTPEDLVKKIILEALIFVEDAIEDYNKKDFKGFTVDTYLIKARLTTLFNKLKPALDKDPGEAEAERIKNLISSGVYKDLIEAYQVLNAWVYNKKLTNIFKEKTFL